MPNALTTTSALRKGNTTPWLPNANTSPLTRFARNST
jgi:hypothetical protein